MAGRAGERAGLVALAVTGLTFLSVWSDLVGHGSGFLGSTGAAGQLANARYFFLMGLTLGTSLHFFFPRLIRSAEGAVMPASAVASVAATLVFAYPLGLEGARAASACAASLFFIGVGYGVFVLRLICMVAYEGSYRHGVYALSASLILKTLIVCLLSAYASGYVQAVVAVVSPMVVGFSVMRAQALVDASEDTPDLMELPKVSGSDRRVLLALLMILPVLRALVRAFSHMGFWGDGYLASESFGAGLVVVGALVLVCSRLALVSEQGDDFVFRFIPPFLIVLAAIPLLQPQMAAELGIPDAADYWAVTFVELFSQVFHWALIVVALQNVDIYPYRIEGIAYGIYGLSSLAFVWMRDAGAPSDLVFFCAMYLFICALVAIVRDYHASSIGGTAARGAAGREARTAPRMGRGARGLSGEPAAGQGGPGRSEGGPDADSGALAAVARDYGLSPRETEVFMLLMQGRSRAFIQNELFLAEGTVKTHTSRIYRKLGVDNKQDMITLVRQLAGAGQAARGGGEEGRP